MQAQDGFDFTRLDSKAAQFDLVIDATEEVDVPSGVSHQVSGAIQTLARLIVERVADEFSRGQIGRRRYPRANPAPPMHNSPGMPTGTGCRCRSST
jgi:hypothetical protein